MKDKDFIEKVFPTAEEDVEAAEQVVDTPQTRSHSYRLAYNDTEFMLRDELRPVRLQLELIKPELLQQQYGINSTVVIFGSASIPDAETAEQNLRQAQNQVDANPSDMKN